MNCEKLMCDAKLKNRQDWRLWSLRGGHPDKGGSTEPFKMFSICVESQEYCDPKKKKRKAAPKKKSKKKKAAPKKKCSTRKLQKGPRGEKYYLTSSGNKKYC
jgi:hypothetical protein